MPPILEIADLACSFSLPSGELHAVESLSLTLAEGDSLALVGESGCGKSVTAYAVMQLLAPPGRIVSGSVRLAGEELIGASPERLCELRGNRMAMIFQEPMTSLNPVLTVEDQIGEVLRLHQNLRKEEVRNAALLLLEQVGIPAAAERLRSYPHQLSGGMRQRVMIAMALACHPALLLADEPTTALDVTIQAQILALIDELCRAEGMGLLLITHDLGIVAERTNRTAVMYAGLIVEQCLTAKLINGPLHPYTNGLLASLPQRNKPGSPLATIQGSVTRNFSTMNACPFRERCTRRFDQCDRALPPLFEPETGRQVRCWLFQ